MEAIWKTQHLSPVLEENIIAVSKFVHELITNPPGGANIGEWCKKPKCWDSVKEQPYMLTAELEDELISVDKAAPVISAVSGAATSGFNIPSTEETELIDKAASIGASTWYALSKWAKETDNFQGWQRSIIFSVGQVISRGKKPSYKQSVQAMKAFQEATEKGFQPKTQ